MSRFSIRYPYLIIVICLMVCVIGASTVSRMPVDLFPSIKIPVVVVATFFSGMPPEQIENDITGRFERFFTLGSGIDHIESRSLPGVSLIKVYFQPGTNADSAVTTISNLAMANLRRLPPGTLPPVVLKFDASSLPVCLITLKGEGLNETKLRDTGQFTVRNQVANVPGASVPQPFGGKYRQIMVYVDPLKLEAHQLSVMDVVRSVNESNLILPAGDVKIGPFDYSLYTNSQVRGIADIDAMPLKTVNGAPVLVGDVGHAADGAQIQTNIVRVDGQKSAYLPVLKQGGDANTIAVVDGIKKAVANLVDIPKSLVAKVVFDQSVFVKTAIENLLHEGAIGLVLTGLMILIFLGNMRATLAVFLSIPLSALATFIGLSFGDSSINSMILGGLALAFSRLIDNSVVVLENIFRHLELGETPEVAAEKGGSEVALPVLAATLTTAIVFFPVTFLYGVSRFLFTALALSVVLSLFASYVVAMTVVPLFCAKLIKGHGGHDAAPDAPRTLMGRFNAAFNVRFGRFLDRFDRSQALALGRPVATILTIVGVFLLSLCLIPKVGLAYFPRTDPGQFVVNLKAATGTRVEATEQEVAKVEALVRRVVSSHDLRLIAANIGVTPDFSAMYTSNSASHTAFVQVSLNDDHTVGSYEYMDRMRKAMREELPELNAYFQSGGLVDAVLNLGLPAPIDIQVTGSDLEKTFDIANKIASQVRGIPGVSDVLVPQDVDAPAFQLNIDRERASDLGLNEKEVISNVVTALTSNQMIAPSFWVDPHSGNDYLLTVQYPESTVKTLTDLRGIPLRAPSQTESTRLDSVTSLVPMRAPTEVDHYQLRRVIDIYVAPQGEELGTIARAVQQVVDKTEKPEGVRVTLRGSVQAMNSSFTSFGLGLILALVLVYLILVAQFKSFVDPLLILLAVPPGIVGVLLILSFTETTLNVMSLMGVVMMAGIVVSNSILIVEFTHRLMEDGASVREAVQTSCRVRLRPILMTSLATIFGLIPMAMKLGTGSEAYAPLARAIIGGLLTSLVMTIYIVPAAFLMVYRRREERAARAGISAPSHATPALVSIIGGLVALGVFFGGTVEARAIAEPPVEHLSLQDAEELALSRAPDIAQAFFRAEAAKQVVRQARAAYFPQITGNIAAVATFDDIADSLGRRPVTGEDTRIGAPGGLNNPTILSHEGNGINATQLLTDFGRTHYLVTAAQYEALSEGLRMQLARAQVLYWVDQAYFHVLEGQSLLRVAHETVENRQLIFDRASAFAKAELRSNLDVSLANVSLQQARLFVVETETRLGSASADLTAALGFHEPRRFVLVNTTVAAPPNADLPWLVAEALDRRPDLQALRFQRDSAIKRASAEKVAALPRVSFATSAGRTAMGEERVRQTYGAAGVLVEVPIFTGGRITARASEATLLAQAAQQTVESAEARITRDVNITWLSMAGARKKIDVTSTLLSSATDALELATSRYERGVASLLELSQAELAKTQAQIDHATAKFEYEIDRSALDFQTGALLFAIPPVNSKPLPTPHLPRATPPPSKAAPVVKRARP